MSARHGTVDSSFTNALVKRLSEKDKEPYYNYTFTAVPSARMQNAAMLRYWSMAKREVTMPFTESEFKEFKDGLEKHDILLDYVWRVPYHDQESA